jgi:hypothetical protein
MGGLINPVFENTARVIMDRRLKILQEMGQKATFARGVADYWKIATVALAEAVYDIPGFVAYGIEIQDETILSVVGQIGLTNGHPFFPRVIDLTTLSARGLEGYILRVLNGETVIIENEAVLAAFERRAWGDILTRAVLVPIKPSTTRPPQGFLFLVLSPRRPYDEDYALWVELLTRQVASSLTNVQLLEEDTRRTKEIAEADRLKGEELQKALTLRTKQLNASEGFMGRLAEICPVGIFVSDDHGEFSFVNDTWVRSHLFIFNLVPNHIVSTLIESVELAYSYSS